MSDLNRKIGTLLDNNTDTNLQSELDKIKDLTVKVNIDTQDITASVQRAIQDAYSKIPAFGINIYVKNLA